MNQNEDLQFSRFICNNLWQVTAKFLSQVLITDRFSDIYMLSESKCYTNKDKKQLLLISDEFSDAISDHQFHIRANI